MKLRNIPYGYRYINGVKVVDERERKIFEEMCQDYLSGKSLLEIAKGLNSRNIEYMPGVTGWNKSRVIRLLEDKRYLGLNNFPQIMTGETYDAIQELRTAKNTQKGVDRQADIFQIKLPINCPKCGGEMKRTLDRRNAVQMRWACTNIGCLTSIGKEDESLIGDIVSVINELIANPEQIIIPTESEVEVSAKLFELEQGIAGIVSATQFDRDAAIERIFEYVSKLYDEIDCTPSKARRIKDFFTNAEPLTDFNDEFFNQTVDSIKLYTDGTISLVLLNHQEIRSGGCYGTS